MKTLSAIIGATMLITSCQTLPYQPQIIEHQRECKEYKLDEFGNEYFHSELIIKKQGLQRKL